MPERAQPFLDPLASEPVHRQQVEAALQRLKRLIAANTTADGALENRVIDLEDAPDAVTDHGGLTGLGDDDHTQYALAGAATASRLTQATARLLGRTSASSGAIEEITVGSGLSLAAGSLTGTVSAPTEGHGIDISGTAIAVDETELNYATPVAVGAALAAGSAATLVHSDHVHTLSPAGLDAGAVFYEVDFSSLANNTLTAGTETIDSLSWTVAGDTFLGTFDILNGTGLRMTAGTSLGTHSTWTSATQDAPYLYLPLSSIPNWNGVSDIVIELYISSLTLETANEYIFAALWNVAASPHSTSAARVRKFTWIASGGNILPSVTIDGSQTNGTEVRAGQNILSLRVSPNGHAHCSWGTWSSGWPTRVSGTMTMTTSVTQINPFLIDSARLVIGMGVLNDASPTTAAVVQRMRVRRA